MSFNRQNYFSLVVFSLIAWKKLYDGLAVSQCYL